jgi:hypothetical protein
MLPESIDPALLYTAVGATVLLLGTILTFLTIWQRQSKNNTSQLLNNVQGLVGALTDGKGKPSVSCGADPITIKRHEGHFASIKRSLDKHGELLQDQVEYIERLDKGQKEILDHITSISDHPPPQPPLPDEREKKERVSTY